MNDRGALFVVRGPPESDSKPNRTPLPLDTGAGDGGLPTINNTPAIVRLTN